MARLMKVYAYKFGELDENIQQRVIERWRHNDTFFWADEWRDSLTIFAKHAPITIRDWNVGYPGTYVRFEMDEDDNYGDGLATMSGVRAWKWLMNNGWDALANPGLGKSCPFTGYCGDETLLDAIRTAIANPSSIISLYSLFQECLSDWAKAFEQDYDYWYSEEAIREDIEAHDYEFYGDGSPV